MENAATDLASSLTTNASAAQIVGGIQPYIPWVAGLLVVFIGIYIARRAMKGTSKLKFKF